MPFSYDWGPWDAASGALKAAIQPAKAQARTALNAARAEHPAWTALARRSADMAADDAVRVRLSQDLHQCQWRHADLQARGAALRITVPTICGARATPRVLQGFGLSLLGGLRRVGRRLAALLRRKD